MDAGSQAGVPDELLGGFKTGDIADRGKNGQIKVDAKARYLESESQGIPPLGGIAEAGDLGIQVGNQRLEVIEDFKGVAKEDLFGGGEGNGNPPGKVFIGERNAWRKLEHVAMKETVKADCGSWFGSRRGDGGAPGDSGLRGCGRGEPIPKGWNRRRRAWRFRRGRRG
jgi:hypothetical protein